MFAVVLKGQNVAKSLRRQRTERDEKIEALQASHGEKKTKIHILEEKLSQALKTIAERDVQITKEHDNHGCPKILRS